MNSPKIYRLVDANPRFAPKNPGRLESAASPVHLARRVNAPVRVVERALQARLLSPVHNTTRAGDWPKTFMSDELNDFSREVAFSAIQRAIEFGADEVGASVALNSYLVNLDTQLPKVTEFSTIRSGATGRFERDEEERSTLATAAGTATKVAGAAALAGGAIYARGRFAAGAERADKLGLAKTAILGGRILKKDATAAVGAAGKATSAGLELLRRAKLAALTKR